ncbi:(E3-independent) E2 ubiquitin-conjugating enzyme UBE2O [Sitophilus oryzae]|uniref:(E3-independent) E2 ubiquitin-conjugating enzyme UBE2O n=1 Tax=Sitophilus oryzae TaxID=7048 RepID=A0A6J2X4W5_SITOR|nr:(E3-independent) E2 ubiquitin-conjugating enzyme UBE2O [Sitophilus oryzae]
MAQEKVKEFYSNDIVYRFDKHKRIVFGVVVDSYEASSDDVDDSQALQKGQIRVLWSTGPREQIWRQNKVRLINRSIIPGDIVRRLEKGKETQRGYCKETKQIATVQIVGTDKVIEHVSSERLHSVRPYDVDDAVCFGNKFGRIENIDQLISMQSKDGSVVEVLTSINNDLDDYWLSKRNRISFDTYYPGQEVICVPINFEQPNWIKKSKVMKRNIQQRQRFTIQQVTDVMIEVALYNHTGYSRIYEISNDDVKRLKVFERLSDACLELAERRLLKLNSHDILLKKKDWVRKLSLMYRPDVPKVRHIVNCSSKINFRVPRIRSSSFEKEQRLILKVIEYLKLEKDAGKPLLPVSAVYDRTSEALGISCSTMQRISFRGIVKDKKQKAAKQVTTFVCSVEFLLIRSMDILLEDVFIHCGSGASSQDASVVNVNTKNLLRKKHYPPKSYELNSGHTLPVEVICVESKITVIWQDGTEEKDIPSTQLYYSISLDDHEFFPGEWVINYNKIDDSAYGVVQQVNYIERTATIKWFRYLEDDKKPEALSTEELSVYDLKKHSKFGFRPGSVVKSKPTQEGKMGKVIDSCIEGYVIVEWLDNKQENCWPQDIELIPDTPDYEYSDSGESSDEEKVSWETESVESYAGGDLSNETVLQNMAARLDFVRSRIIYLKEAFKNHSIIENFAILKDLLLVYENSSYLDKLLGTSFFSLKSKHFQALLTQAKERAKQQNIELRGRLFSSDEKRLSGTKIKVAESDNIKKMIKLENKINSEIEKKEGNKETTATTPLTPDSVVDVSYISQENLCIELLSTLKVRMDLAYAEIISKIGGTQALSVLTKATDNFATPANSTPLPSCPTTPEDSFSILSPLKPKKCLTVQTDDRPSLTVHKLQTGENEWYNVIDEAPLTHHYYSSKFDPTDYQKFIKAVMREYKLLKESLPDNVWVRSYSNRIDLLSVMIQGPAKTPYEDGLFLFDVQLGVDYPRSPPLVHYISYSSERLNPNLYVEGKVCISLLGTWVGKGTEVWGPESTLLQLIVSIQGLILVSEPYYNEAGYDKQTDTQQGYENSRTYNELVILKLVQSMTELLSNPPDVFKTEILRHFTQNGEKLCQRLEKYCDSLDPLKPEFPLLPVSKGLKLSLATALKLFRDVLIKKTEKLNTELSDEKICSQ